MLMGYHPDYESMYEYFRSLGYELVFKPMIIGEDIDLKWNIDTDLVLRVMKERRNYDKAIICSGDGDFMSLVSHLKSKKKLWQIIVPHSGRYSHFLEEAAGEYITSLTGKKRWLAYVKWEKKKTVLKKKNTKLKEDEKQTSKKDLTSKKTSKKTQDNKKKHTSKNPKRKNTAKSKVILPTWKKSKDNASSNKKETKKVSSYTKKRSKQESTSTTSIWWIQFPSGVNKKGAFPKSTTRPKAQSNAKKKSTKKRTKIDPSHNTRFFD